MKTQTFKLYISRILKTLDADRAITWNAKEQLNAVITHIARIIIETANKLCIQNNRKTLRCQEIQAAAIQVFNGQMVLRSEVMTKGTDAIARFTKVDGRIFADSRTSRAGLRISVSVTENLIRQVKNRIGSMSAVYLAGVLEYMVTEILKGSIDIAKYAKKVRVTVRHLYQGIFLDKELSDFFKTHNIVLVGGGVIADDVGNKYQKSTKLLFQKAPFESIVRFIASKFCPTPGKPLYSVIQFGAGTIIILQKLIEHHLISFLEDVKLVAEHAVRQTVYAKDIDLVRNLKVIDYNHVYIKNLMCGDYIPLSKPGYTRLARRAGIYKQKKDKVVTRISADFMEPLMWLTYYYMSSYLSKIVAIKDYNKVVTITPTMIRQTLELEGVNVAI